MQDLPRYESEHPACASELTLRLSLNETRAATIAKVLEVYTKTRSIEQTAKAFSVCSRTLDRLIRKTPELTEGMNKIREQWEQSTGREWSNSRKRKKA